MCKQFFHLTYISLLNDILNDIVQQKGKGSNALMAPVLDAICM